MKVDILVQGSSTLTTFDALKIYRSLDFVDKVILSSYDSTIPFRIPEGVTFVNNDLVAPGIGNRNLQINTTKNGLEKVESKYCIKIRSDLVVSALALKLMIDYWIKHDNPETRIKTVGEPMGRLYVLSLATKFVYHPRDHIFCGFTEDMRKFFDCPFDTFVNTTSDNVQDPYSAVYDHQTQTEMWLGMHYYARYDADAANHKTNFQQYITNKAPMKDEAWATEKKNLDRLFVSFPEIKGISWPKHNLTEYPYDWIAINGEYWSKD